MYSSLSSFSLVIGLPMTSLYSPRLPHNKPLLSINTASEQKKESTSAVSHAKHNFLPTLPPIYVNLPHKLSFFVLSNASSPLPSMSPPIPSPYPPSSRHLVSNLPTSQTPNNRPAELDNRVDKTRQNTGDSVHDSHDAITDGAEGGDELCLGQWVSFLLSF